jgi:hypothetical protein
VENNLQQDTTEFEGCFQTPAQSVSVSVSPTQSMDCVRCSPHKHTGSDEQTVRPQCLCDLVTYEHRSMASVQIDKKKKKELYFTYNSDPNCLRPLLIFFLLTLNLIHV